MGSDNCLTVTGRITLCILNTIFLILGFVLMILGILVFAYTPALDIILGSATTAFSSSISGDTGAVFEAKYLVDIIQAFAYILIGLGVVFFIIALMGIIGGCCKVKCILFTYIILMVLLIIGQIVLMIIVFSERQVLDSSIKDPMLRMTESYTGFAGKDIDSITLNFLMLTLGCCGVNGYTDFKSISSGGKWNNTYSTFTLVSPVVCCVDTANLPGCAEAAGIIVPSVSNADKGCYDGLWDAIDAQSDMLIGICSAIIILQALLCFFAIYIVYKESKDE